MRLSLSFRWYDFWVGWFYDRKKRTLYICPLPMCVITFKPDGAQQPDDDADEIILDVLRQSCYDYKHDPTVLHHHHISAYEDALMYLDRRGLVDKISDTSYYIVSSKERKP